MADHPKNFNDETPATAPAGPSLLGKLRILLFVVGIVVAECLVAYLYLPGEAETAAMAEASHRKAPPPQPDPLKALEEEEDDLANQIEVDMEQFSVSAYQPLTNTTLRIDFHLWGVVHAENEVEFIRLKDENLNRFREQVIVTVRSASLNDLTDAGLGLLKRKILEKTNKLFGKPLLKAVIVSDFSFIEQ